MSEPVPTIRVGEGRAVDAVGLGLWKIGNDAVADLLHAAVEVGYRHLDSACDYGNEPQVGEGIRRALHDKLCTREELWITSKLWNTYHDPAHVRAACERSLGDLGLEYLDLYLVHFPIALAFVPFEERYPPGWTFDPDAERPAMRLAPVPIAETWGAMQELVTAGLVREIGVANFGVALLRELLYSADRPPAMLQVELHPYLAQDRLVRFCRESDIAVTGFSPLGAGSYVELGMAASSESVLAEPVVKAIAERHGVTPAQAVLRWGVQRGTAVIPKTSRVERLKENIALGFTLTGRDMADLATLDRGRRFNDPGEFGEAAFNTFVPIFD